MPKNRFIFSESLIRQWEPGFNCVHVQRCVKLHFHRVFLLAARYVWITHIIHCCRGNKFRKKLCVYFAENWFISNLLSRGRNDSTKTALCTMWSFVWNVVDCTGWSLKECYKNKNNCYKHLFFFNYLFWIFFFFSILCEKRHPLNDRVMTFLSSLVFQWSPCIIRIPQLKLVTRRKFSFHLAVKTSVIQNNILFYFTILIYFTCEFLLLKRIKIFLNL